MPEVKKEVVDKPSKLTLTLDKNDSTLNPMTATYINEHGVKYTWSVYYTPTNNCQISCISEFAHMLNVLPKKEVYSLIGQIFKAGRGKAMLLVDIREQYENNVKNMFGKHIRYSFPYHSTNGSHMRLILINMLDFYQEVVEKGNIKD